MRRTGAWKRLIRVAGEQRSHIAVIRERSELAGGRSQNPRTSAASRETSGAAVSIAATIRPPAADVWQESDHTSEHQRRTR